MYLGKVVEMETADRLFVDPQHEYTRRLLAAVPTIDLAMINGPFNDVTGRS